MSHRGRHLTASLVAFGLTALLGLLVAGCESKDAATARCRKTCAPNFVQSIVFDLTSGASCFCQQTPYCDDFAVDAGADGGRP